MNIKYTYLIILIFVSVLSSVAQGTHFSQFNTTPIHVNPANSGNFNGCYRVNASYRNQWNSVSTPFVTYMISFDEPVLTKKFTDNRYGIGVLLINDQFSTKGFNHFTGATAFTTHRYLDYDKIHKISGGIQLAIVQKSLNLSQFSFLNQYDKDQGFNLDLPNGEPFRASSTFYPDISIGAIYEYLTPSLKKIIIGGSIHHLLRPKESFLLNSQNRIHQLYNFHASLIYRQSESTTIRPSLLYMYQSKTQTFIIGFDIIKGIEYSDHKVKLLLGVWYRNNDALILSGGLSHKNHMLSIGYDLNISGLSLVSGYKGGIEFSYRHILKCFPKIPLNFTIPCIRL